MSFNDDTRIDSSKVKRAGRGRTTGIAAGGVGIVGVIVVALISQFTGVDLSGLVGGAQVGVQMLQQSGSAQPTSPSPSPSKPVSHTSSGTSLT